MMNSNSGRSIIRYPFTASQWQELEHQALVYKYMVSGMPVPPDLLYTIRRSLDSSLSSKFLLHQPHHMGWNSFQMGFGRKIDPEPGRCRRTDGKKWRCSKEAYPDSKYCERHMHRGRNRSRKPVEILSTNNNNTTTTSPPTAVPLTKTTFSSSNTESHLLYPHFTSSKPQGLGHHESTTNFFLENNGYSHSGVKDYRHAMKGEIQSDELSFFSEASSNSAGTMMRNNTNNNDPWELSPLTMGSPQMKHKLAHSSSSGLQLQSLNDINSSMQQQQQQQQKHYYSLNLERDDQPRKVMHHFLDEGPQKDKDSSNWLNSHDQDKMSSHHKTQLSMSIPNSMHDFFMTQKW